MLSSREPPRAAPKAEAPARLLRRCACGQHTGGGECAECRKRKRQLDREAVGGSEPATAPEIVHQVLATPGKPLDPGARSYFEPRFGRDFSGVRVHTGAAAAESAKAVDALAYTVGRDIVFGAGRFAPEGEGGRRLLAHELTHVVQQGSGPAGSPGEELAMAPADGPQEQEANRVAEGLGGASVSPGQRRLQRLPPTSPLARGVCEANASSPTTPGGGCSYRDPEHCPTYEGWIHNFILLKSFSARATPSPGSPPSQPNVFTVLGDQPAARRAKVSDKPKAGDKTAAAPTTTSEHEGERFIDHPTDEWVKTCLPENLRATAYQLPSDCADIAVILRHVWLAAHHRTETFGDWTIGSQTGKAESASVLKTIGEVYTGNVDRMVNAYSDPQGVKLLSFASLEPLLHIGDVLVWSHHENGFDKARTGGHTHTIAGIDRDDKGKITSLQVLQGNQPIFGEADPPASGTIGPDDDKGLILKELKQKDTKAARSVLGNLPGRRIEADTLSRDKGDFADSDPSKDKSARTTWVWHGHTLLVAAGPPKAAPRPAARKVGGKTQPRALTDWVPALEGAAADKLAGVFEATLLEARALLEGGTAIATADATQVAQAAGKRLWKLAKAAGGLAEKEHFRPLETLLGLVDGVRSFARTGKSTFNLIETELEKAARGGEDLDYAKGVPKGADAVNVLVTGFDPFESSGSLKRPAAGEWNAAGAAALALDGQRLPVPTAKKKTVAAVEGIVLPVSFDRFDTGLVEAMVKPHLAKTDAAISVSLDPNLGEADPVRLEHFAVGVRNKAGKLEAVPAAPGGTAGPAFLGTTADLPKIAAATEKKATKPADAIPKPTVDATITFRFEDAARADRALTLLGLPAQGKAEPKIGDVAALNKVAASMTTRADGVTIDFKLGTESFNARVLSGPGGDFLSNEVSYRLRRLILQQGSATTASTFHVHTPAGQQVPEPGEVPDKDRRTALGTAIKLKDKLIATLKRIILAVADAVLGRRAAAATPPSSGGSKP
ncbi:MAG TPA: DUF4157 domain-containing protein [Thermoanaerobaculia bacterium]|nr:DUF4157 domain-containing protein [Thermoanaerobaculia bacterium]